LAKKPQKTALLPIFHSKMSEKEPKTARFLGAAGILPQKSAFLPLFLSFLSEKEPKTAGFLGAEGNHCL